MGKHSTSIEVVWGAGKSWVPAERYLRLRWSNCPVMGQSVKRRLEVWPVSGYCADEFDWIDTWGKLPLTLVHPYLSIYFNNSINRYI